MVYYSNDRLDATFAALADPTRRAMVQRLAGGAPLSVGDLAAPFAMSLPAVLKHLRVLTESGLVAREKVGRTVMCRAQPPQLELAIRWLADMQAFWSDRLDALAELIDGNIKETPTWPTPNSKTSSTSARTAKPASGLNARSRRRRTPSIAPGLKPKR